MKKITFLLSITALFLSSCNLPSANSPESAEAVQTSAALTVEAALKTPLVSPTLAPATSNNAQATPSDSSGQPFASFEDVTNCRTGPGVNYERITQIVPEDSVQIIGFYPPNYWVVMTDTGPCWVAGEFVTPSGSLAAVPTVTAPPTPQGGAPDNVSLQQWNVSCNYATNEADVSIRWKDKDNESGYRVFRNNELAAELPANSTEFIETISLLSGQSVGYYIVAFNAVGDTSSKTITLSC
ncbi:MAG: SH3 domain-containing protein [Anaerolineales bacterium]|nr:SH3 domain-containing protein [Anaerolineales bacterium]